MLVVDSSASTAIVASGNAKVTAAGVQVEGGVSKSGNAVVTKTGDPGATGDPLAGLAEPAVPGTGAARLAESLSGNSTATINPGLYSQITVSGNAKLTLSPGVYVDCRRWCHGQRQRRADGVERHLHHRGGRLLAVGQRQRQRGRA